jgi:uncharacterized protein
VSEDIRSLLSDLKVGLALIYGKRLKGVYLFGSYARDEQDSESDVDVMIVLSHYNRYPLEIQRTSELVSALSLQYGYTLSRIFVRETEFHHGDTPLLRNLRQEAVKV